MKKSTKVTILIAVAVQVIALFAYAGLSGAATSNVVSVHKDQSSVTNFSCILCHENKKREQSLARGAKYVTAHKKHLTSSLLQFQCRTCHSSTVTGNNWNTKIQAGDQQHSYEGNLSYASTDSYETGTRKARKNVAPDFCRVCHGQFPTAKHGGTNYATTAPTGCMNCHDGTDPSAPTPANAHSYNAANSSRDAVVLKTKAQGGNGGVRHRTINARRTRCANCHGSKAWFQTTNDY